MIDLDAMDSEKGLRSEQESNQISPAKMKAKKHQLRQNQLVRENRRLRNSASFRIGKIFTKAATQPWRLPLLPFSVVYLIFSIGMERLGRWPVPVDQKGTSAVQQQEARDSVIFFPQTGLDLAILRGCTLLPSVLRSIPRRLKLCFSRPCQRFICCIMKGL